MASNSDASAEMVVVTTASDLASALNDVPVVLLDAEHRDVRDRALSSLDALGTLEVDPTRLVVIGGGGSGKSSVVNALVGSDVVAASPVRPTTIGVSVIGRSYPTAIEGVAEYVFTDRLTDGIVIVDTPSWDSERESVVSAATDAHTVVVVLTPARYGDAVTSEIVRALPDSINIVIIANRMPHDPDENDDLVDDIEATLGREIHTQVTEGESIDISGSVLSNMPVDVTFIERLRSYERDAADGGRRIARSISASAAELGDIESILADTATPSIKPDLAWTGDDWPATCAALIDDVKAATTAFDDDIVGRSGNDLAVRINARLPMPDMEALPAALEDWRSDTSKVFRRRSSPMWRRRSTFDLVDRWSWIASIDAGATPPRRVGRAMHGALEATTRNTRAKLTAILDEAVRMRLGQWTDMVSEVGDYRPGVLFAASEAVDGGESADE
jgi:GTPase SAR1 family protein